MSISTVSTPLGEQMRKLADSGHADADELRDLADKFETATAGYYGDPQTVPVRSFMGHYARARMCWSRCSGEPLV
jgi:hypothetical protein